MNEFMIFVITRLNWPMILSATLFVVGLLATRGLLEVNRRLRLEETKRNQYTKGSKLWYRQHEVVCKWSMEQAAAGIITSVPICIALFLLMYVYETTGVYTLLR